MLFSLAVILRLFRHWTAFSLRRLGATSYRRQFGDTSLLIYRVGPETGEPWILLHGLASTAMSWHSVVRQLRGECQIFIPELSSIGGTSTPGEGLDVRTAVEVLSQWLTEDFQDQPVSLAGISLGGWTAVRTALAFPELIERLVLINAGGYRNQDWEKIQQLVTVDSLRDIDPLYEALFARVPWPFPLIRHAFFMAYSSPGVRHTLNGIREHDSFDRDDLARISIPTAMIWGAHDGLFPLSAAREMAEALPQCDLHIFDECAHALQWEDPPGLAEAVDRFRRKTAR